MSKAKWLWMLLAVVMIAIVVGAYLWWQGEQSEPTPAPPAPPEPRVEAPAPPPPAVSAPVAPAEPTVLHPIETAQQQVAGEPPGKEGMAPTLEGSDVALQDALAGLYGAEASAQFFHLNDIVRRMVATVDNLPGKQVASRLLPMKPPGGLFVTRSEGGALYLSPDNYPRYAQYIRLLQSVDPKKLVSVYVRLYPLFQQAYQELGYPKGYFNDRLVEVIDHLLATPNVEGRIRLVQPRVLYQFEDPKLEALSAGQKLLIRMGSEHAGKVKAYLREIRQALTGQLAPH